MRIQMQMRMDILPDKVLHQILGFAGYGLNVAMINRHCYQLLKSDIRSISLAKRRDLTVEFLEWVYSVIGKKMFEMDFEYAHREDLIVFYHEHNSKGLNMALETAKRGYLDMTQWCLEHGWQWHPEIGDIAVANNRKDLLKYAE